MSHFTLLAEGENYWLVVPFVAALLLLAQAAWRKRRMEAARAETETSPARAQHTPSEEAPSDLIRWQVDMHDLARELRATLDSKLVLLEQLVRDARHEADRLERAVEQSRQSRCEAENRL